MDDISIVNLCWMKYSEFYWGVPDFDRFLYLKLGFPLILRTLYTTHYQWANFFPDYRYPEWLQGSFTEITSYLSKN